MNVLAVNAMLGGLVSFLGTEAKFKVAAGSTLLGVVVLAAPPGSIDEGVLTLAAAPDDNMAVGTGVPTTGWLEATDGTVVETFSAGGPGSGAQVIVTVIDAPEDDPPGKMYAGGKFYLGVVTLGQ